MILSLIGLPGVGKSAVGSLLSGLLRKQLVDTDRLFVLKYNCPIAEYFDIHGEEAFRDAESDLLAVALQVDNIILSTGGGIILRQDNRKLLRSQSQVVYLNSNPDLLELRLAASPHRPLFRGQNPLLKIRTLWSERSELYLQTAHFSISTDNKNAHLICEEIVDTVMAKF